MPVKKIKQAVSKKLTGKSKENEANPLWGGHFSVGPTKLMEKINASIDFDKKLYKYDIKGSIAHCKMLVKSKIISSKEGNEIISNLGKIEKEIEQEKFIFKASLEDIHMNIENRLHQMIGDTAGKLHTARSRNDQVATDFKLFVRDSIDSIINSLGNLNKELTIQAKQHYNSVMPGFTHLQTAQPVTLGHHLLAYVEMFKRDISRFKDGRARLNECPLGSAALAGTSFPIDRKMTAKLLDFDRPTANSIDSVSDRDFAIEFLSNASICAMHLSRMGEELVMWASSQFSFVQLPENFTSGSSIMPQKRNPDAAELVRAKTGRIYGALTTLLTVMKGLSLTYSKDMQEDKEPVFDAVENLHIAIDAMSAMIHGAKFNTVNMKSAASKGFSTATDLADWLVQNLNIPFRKAHIITGKIVNMAEKKNCQLHELDLEELQSVEAGINNKIFKILDVERSIESRTSYGGTAPSNVKKACD